METQFDALGECGGSCLEDADADRPSATTLMTFIAPRLTPTDDLRGPGSNPIIENVQVIYDSVYAVDISEWVAFVTSIDHPLVTLVNSPVGVS